MSPEATNSHDTFFKQLMSDSQNVRDFIRGFLPEAISANIDLASIDYKDFGINHQVEFTPTVPL